MKTARGGLQRALERELVEGLGARRRRALIERLRGNAGLRRGWDRAIAAFRALEQREVSRFEIEQVERWLLDDLDDLGLAAGPRAQSRRWTTIAAALATVITAASLLLWIDLGPEHADPGALDGPGELGELQARGDRGWARPLAIEPVCGRPARSAASRGCGLDELLGFSLRLGDEQLDPAAAMALGEAPLHLSVFGVGAEGELFYYLPTPQPTPDDPLETTLRLGAGWQALPLSVRLQVNHAPGRVRVFALVGDATASVDEIHRWAAALASQPLPDLDTPPWHLRLPPGALDRVCPRPGRCASAEAELTILPPEQPEPPEPPEHPRTEP